VIEAIEHSKHRLTIALLKKLKTRNAFIIEDNDFSIQRQRVRLELADGFRDLRIAVGSINRVPRNQRDLCPLFVRKHSNTVVLFFKNPIGSRERGVNEGCKHRSNTKRNFGHRQRSQSRIGLYGLVL